MVVYRGKDAKILIDDTEVGYAESVTIDIARNVEQIWEIGSNLPAYLAEGNVEITGSMDRAFVDLALVSLVGETSSTTLPEFSIVAKCATLPEAPIISLSGCKVDSATEDISQDGTVMFNIDFIATSYSIGTIS